MKKTVRIDKDNWARCGECGHKLFRLNPQHDKGKYYAMHVLGIEIKCHSCKSINVLRGDGYEN